MKLNAKRIEKHLKNLKVNSFYCVNSTNTLAKKLAEKEANRAKSQKK